MSESSKISDKIIKEINKITKDPNERQFLKDLLGRELTYVNQSKPDFKSDFKKIIEYRFPYNDTNK